MEFYEKKKIHSKIDSKVWVTHRETLDRYTFSKK